MELVSEDKEELTGYIQRDGAERTQQAGGAMCLRELGRLENRLGSAWLEAGQGYKRGGVVRRCNGIRRPGLVDERSYMPSHGV